MGSKRKYCKDIVPIIQKYIDENNITTFVDCFCGGANLGDKIKCQKVICNDLSPTLIALHQQAQKDFSLIPTDGDKDYWDAARAEWNEIKKMLDDGTYYSNYKEKDEMLLYKIGAIEWYGSYSNGGFRKGYAKNSVTRNYYQEAYRNHKKQSETENYKNIIFIQGDYKVLKTLPFGQTVMYCDSPYKSTQPYGIQPNFNFNEYYNWLKETSKKFPIFVSEQSLPKDFEGCLIWEKNDVTRTIGTDNNFKACEKLFLIDNREKNGN